MKIKVNSQELTAKSVLGGVEMVQGTRRGYLEFVFEPDGVTVDWLDGVFASGTDEITLTDEETGEVFMHSGYVVRGAVRVYPLADGNREIAVRQYRKTDAEERIENVVAVVPALAAQQAAAANGEAGAMRVLAGTLAPVAAMLPARDWAAGMTTQPGDLVWDKTCTFVYVYSGAAAMTHANPTFFPGAAGVYYWTIIPEMRGGVKVYPAISGIIVAVKRDEVWWNADKTKKYRWNDADNKACSWYPGQAGVHQWVAV